MPNPSTLALDCRCTLGEGIVWSPDLQSVLWTDIEKSTLWMYRPHDGIARQWSLPDRLGCFAMCRSGRLLLGLAKSLAFAQVDFDGDSPLRIAPVMPIEPGGTRTRINDGRTDRAGNFVFGTYNEAQDAAEWKFLPVPRPDLACAASISEASSSPTASASASTAGRCTFATHRQV